MYPYQKPQLELLFDLIKEANPGIEYPFTPATMRVSAPVAQAVPAGGIADTNILVSPKSNEHWFGSVRVQYRRIDVVKMFKNMFPLGADYYALSSDMALMASKLNLQYGTSFVSSDFVTQGAVGSGIAFNQTISSSSICYNSSAAFQLIWRYRKPILGEVSNNQNLATRLFSGGNDFTSSARKPQGEYLGYAIDCTNPGLYGSGSGLITNNAGWVSIFAPLTVTDPRFDVTKNVSETGGVSGLTYVLYTLPSALVPEANSAKYKYVMAISATPTAWFQGRLLMHYN